MTKLRMVTGLFAIGALASAAALACGGSDSDDVSSSGDDAGPRGTELTGQECEAPADCYPGVDAGAIQGEVQCLTRVTNGYCTHLCTKDTDCCATPGECKTGLTQVCAPFESTGQMMCFLSCEDDDVAKGIAAQAPDGGYDGGVVDGGTREDGYCRAYASAAFGCRSTGGGKNNRKVCVP
jgi:hypothetical protein